MTDELLAEMRGAVLNATGGGAKGARVVLGVDDYCRYLRHPLVMKHAVRGIVMFMGEPVILDKYAEPGEITAEPLE